MSDLLASYQKAVFQSRPSSEKPSETELLDCSHHKRYAAYLAYVEALASCSNQSACHILGEKLKEYTSLIDDRKGVNNFASVARSLAHNVTNVSKNWRSRLNESLGDLSLAGILQSSEGAECQNASERGCTAGEPSTEHLSLFFTTLSRVRSEQNQPAGSRHKSDSRPIYHDQAISVEESVSKKKTSLYSTYEDSYLDQLKAESSWKAPSSVNQGLPDSTGRSTSTLVQQRLPYKSSVEPPSDFRSSYNSRGRDELPEKPANKKNSSDRIKKINKFLKEDEHEEKKQLDIFKTAAETLKIQNQTRHGGGGSHQYGHNGNQGAVKKSLGGKGRAASNRFVPPLRSSQEDESDMLITRSVMGRHHSTGGAGSADSCAPVEDERLRHIDPKMVEMIRSEIMDQGSAITWDDIAGLDFAKHTIQEIVVWPMLRPDIFTGLRRPPKGILLFGPPGTGKTLIGKCIASQSKSTFFSISASSLTSKWIGDGEKMVRALFAVARVEQPSVVFIDEIDSLLSQRSDQEHESSRRIKTEFLVQLDGAATGDEDRLLIIGATNRPQELDEAARRRLVKRLYIPLPDLKARKQLVSNLMSKERNELNEQDMDEVARLTDGYSGADMKNLCQEASLGPIRSISASLIASINPDQVRPVSIEDFKTALKRVRSSVSSKDLDLYIEWDKQFGMSS